MVSSPKRGSGADATFVVVFKPKCPLGVDYRLLSKCLLRGRLRAGAVSSPPSSEVSPRPSFSSISLESPVGARDSAPSPRLEPEALCEESFSTSWVSFGAPRLLRRVARRRWSRARQPIWLVSSGWVISIPHSPRERIAFRYGRMSEASIAADILAGVAGGRREFTAFLMDTDFPAFLCRGALEASGGPWGISRRFGVGVPLRVNGMG